MNLATRLNGHQQAFETTAEQTDVASPARPPKLPAKSDVASLGARICEMLAQETPDDLLERLAEFKRSVDDALRRSSSVYQILRQLEESGLKDCARCTEELETRLAGNPHYVVLGKLAEAEKLVTKLTAGRS